MTLDQLRIFVAVAERQHMTQAAHSLNLAQSAASHAIAALEARYDTKLFDRVGRRIELTEAGDALLAEAKAILAQVERTELVLSEFGNLDRGTLSVQASQTIAGYWLPRHLVNFRKAHPRIDIKLEIGNTAQVAEAIENGAAELGFVEGNVESVWLMSTPVAQDQLILVVGPEHPWATDGCPKPTDLLESEWVLREPGSGTRSVLERALVQLGVEPIRGERKINEAEASVVLRVFQDYAAGQSSRTIAHALNADGIPGPFGHDWGPSTIHGSAKRRNGILNNELYIGKLVWN